MDNDLVPLYEIYVDSYMEPLQSPIQYCLEKDLKKYDSMHKKRILCYVYDSPGDNRIAVYKYKTTLRCCGGNIRYSIFNGSSYSIEYYGNLEIKSRFEKMPFNMYDAQGVFTYPAKPFSYIVQSNSVVGDAVINSSYDDNKIVFYIKKTVDVDEEYYSILQNKPMSINFIDYNKLVINEPYMFGNIDMTYMRHRNAHINGYVCTPQGYINMKLKEEHKKEIEDIKKDYQKQIDEQNIKFEELKQKLMHILPCLT